MNYIVTKPMKSKGIAALLVIFFWPFGMFYSTIIGAFTMIGAVPLLIVLISVYKLNLLLIVFFYFVTCFIWAIAAVDSYNNRIQSESYYPVQQKTSTNTRINYKPTNTDNIIENLNEKKRLLFKDLDTITHLHAQKVLSDDVFNKQKDTLLKQLDTLSYNETNISKSPTKIIPHEDYEYIPKEKTSYLFVWILFILLIGSLIYFFYTKGMFVFDNHKKDREEITNQIEKTYFGIINGGFTAEGMQGVGADGLPFYNMKMDNLMVMGFLPLMNFLSSGINLEAKNINVYKFINKNSAKAKYDLVIEDSSKDRSDTVHIDMIVKKIGGNWKLDGQKAFGDKSKSVKKEIQKPIRSGEIQPIKSESELSYNLGTSGRIVKDTTLLYEYQQIDKEDERGYFPIYHYMELTKTESVVPGQWNLHQEYFNTIDYKLTGNIREHWLKLDPDYIDSKGVSHWYKNYKSSKDTGTFEK
ncbi:MAG: hypothetical protein WKF85_03480 [Chitinophagaceae bacterium]